MTQNQGRMQNPAFLAYRFLWKALDWLYPPECPGCGKAGERWCEDCQKGLTRFGPEVCPVCGEISAGGKLCKDCRANPPPFQAVRSWATHEGALRKAIHHLKYQKDIGLAEALAFHLIDLYNDQKWNVDLVTAVPLSRKRLRERGYNQSELLARPLALYLDKPFKAGALRRVRDTASQVGLNAKERKQNVAHAFQGDPKWASGKVILIVDDVTTTGSTLWMCTEALMAAGAAGVYAMTLARPVLDLSGEKDTRTN